MTPRDLDSLLRDKMQFMEEEVSLSEKERIFASFIIEPKTHNAGKSSIIYLLFTLATVSAIVAMYLNSAQNSIKSKPTTKTINSVEKSPENRVSIEAKPTNLFQNKEEILSLKTNFTYGKLSVRGDFSALESNFLLNNESRSEGSKAVESNRIEIADNKTNLLFQRNLDFITATVDNYKLENLKESKELSAEFKPHFDSKRSLLSINFWVAPSISNESASVDKNNSPKVHEEYLALNRQATANLGTVNAGVKLNVHPTHYLTIGTGLGIVNIGNAYKFDYNIKKIPVIDSATDVIKFYINKPDSSASRVKGSGRFVATYLELPVALNLRIYETSRFKLELLPTINCQILVRQNGKQIEFQTLQPTSKIYNKKIQLNYSIGVPFTWKSRLPRISYTAMPYFNFGNKFNSQKYIQTQSQYYGLQCSLNFKL